MLIVLLGSGGIFRPYEEYYEMSIGPENRGPYPQAEMVGDIDMSGPFMTPPRGRVIRYNPGIQGLVRTREGMSPGLHTARYRRTNRGRESAGTRLRGSLPEPMFELVPESPNGDGADFEID